jgi:hypothetical protein
MTREDHFYNPNKGKYYYIGYSKETEGYQYVTDIHTGIFMHEIKAWRRIGKKLYPLIWNGEKLIFAEQHELYKKGYKIIKV